MINLQADVENARKTIIKDGFDMSIGELISIYEKGELIIDPSFQRLFRWDSSRKTRFIESLILGIPIPPIFVFTREDGRWELIDGLQRLSTIFQYADVLKSESEGEGEGEGEGKPSSESFFVPSGTKLLPSLEGVTWNEEEGYNTLPFPIKLDVQRVRVRVEILKRESDGMAKYELFQRLNTGGAPLSEQEIRNCVAVMINPEFFKWLDDLSQDRNFINSTNLTERAKSRQKYNELVLRFLAYRYREYKKAIDVHEWLDDSLMEIASDQKYDRHLEETVFKGTFKLIDEALGADSFKRNDQNRFLGGFLISAFEIISHGVSVNIDSILRTPVPQDTVRRLVAGLWQNDEFTRHTKGGVRGTQRLANLLPHAPNWFKP